MAGKRAQAVTITPCTGTSGVVSSAMVHVSDWYHHRAGHRRAPDRQCRPWMARLRWTGSRPGMPSPLRVPSAREEMLLQLNRFARSSPNATINGRGAIRVGQWKLIYGAAARGPLASPNTLPYLYYYV